MNQSCLLIVLPECSQDLPTCSVQKPRGFGVFPRLILSPEPRPGTGSPPFRTMPYSGVESFFCLHTLLAFNGGSEFYSM